MILKQGGLESSAQSLIPINCISLLSVAKGFILLTFFFVFVCDIFWIILEFFQKLLSLLIKVSKFTTDHHKWTKFDHTL